MNRTQSFIMRPELKSIAESLKVLEDAKIIRTKNLVGDLGEYYCKEFSNLTLNINTVEIGYDAIDNTGKKVEIKTRRLPSNQSKVIFRSFDFDYCLYVELNQYFEPICIIKIESSELRNNLEKQKNRLSVGKIKNKIKNTRIYESND